MRRVTSTATNKSSRDRQITLTICDGRLQKGGAPRYNALEWDHSKIGKPSMITQISKSQAKGKFIDEAIGLASTGRSVAALDLIYDLADSLISKNRLEELSEVLDAAGIRLKLLSESLIVAFLTVTLPVRHRLPGRSDFYRQAAAELEKRGEPADEILLGLES